MSAKKTNIKATETQDNASESKAAVAEAEEVKAQAAEQTEAESPAGQQETAEESAAAGADDTPRGYCGPSVRGVVRQYTVYTGEIPEMVADFIKEHPSAEALLVPTERFAEMRKALETRGTAEAILYKQIRSEI